mmetsp:Transcript_14411/g.47323  ORF Transcript_14411/g.47323 Transcript_14411/m.47323 type:complete len:303 (-) Transcript_14411:1155-2063(-)
MGRARERDARAPRAASPSPERLPRSWGGTRRDARLSRPRRRAREPPARGGAPRRRARGRGWRRARFFAPRARGAARGPPREPRRPLRAHDARRPQVRGRRGAAAARGASRSAARGGARGAQGAVRERVEGARGERERDARRRAMPGCALRRQRRVYVPRNGQAHVLRLRRQRRSQQGAARTRARPHQQRKVPAHAELHRQSQERGSAQAREALLHRRAPDAPRRQSGAPQHDGVHPRRQRRARAGDLRQRKLRRHARRRARGGHDAARDPDALRHALQVPQRRHLRPQQSQTQSVNCENQHK